MSDYLIEHARANVWCAPEMDRQVVFNAKRITAPKGERVSIKAMWEQFQLPNATQLFHVIQIGHYHPLLLGLCPKRRVWYKLSDAMMRQNLMADVYLADGLQLPRTETWVMYTEDRAVLVAVADQPSIANLRYLPIYLRLYSNTFFSSTRSDDFAHRIEVKGRRFTTVNDALLFQNDYNNHRRLERGLTSLYINGRFQLTFLPQSLKVGDTMEFVYDSTVKQVVEFDIAGLRAFDSTLDNKRKYLLSHGGDQIGGAIIDYRDDIDVYFVRKSTQGSQQQRLGHYYSRGIDDAFRMVTHRDYSIAIPYLQGYVDAHPELGNLSEMTVRLHIRHSGQARPLMFEHHRIHELYKLPYQQRLNAMHGAEATVDVWQVANLEQSAYVALMDNVTGNFDRALVEQAYGYNAVARLTGNGPLRVDASSGTPEVILPHGLRYGATMFEYDAVGELLGFYYYAAGSIYRPYNPTCTLVEGRVGRGGYKISTAFGTDAEVTIKPNREYRFYIAPVTSQGVRYQLWEDVTGDTSKYAIVNGKVVWFVDPNFWAVAVRNDGDFLAYNLTMSPVDGLLKFSVDGTAVYPSNSQQGVMQIPFGSITVWLNGRLLLENLDYTVKWPEIVVVNKEYLREGLEQRLTVMAEGFCNPDMSRPAPADHGFVRYGALSHNNRFNVRDDRVMRIAVRGCVKHRDDLRFVEDDPSVYIDDVINGSPYAIDSVTVPVRPLTSEPTQRDYRERSAEVDAQIEGYLSLHLPERPEPNPNMIPNRYWVYSPFTSVIMHHLLNGFIPMEDFRGQYSDLDVREALEGYTYLLDYDPTQKDLNLDLVSIHPHDQRTVVKLSIFQRNFLARAVRVFLGDKVDLSKFIEVDPNAG